MHFQFPKGEKLGRLMYIIEAAAEYMVALTVGGTFFATITKELGFSDSLTGILSALSSLGCLCQLLSMAFRPRRTKGFVIGASVLNQLLFALWYIIPLSGAQRPVKTVLFVGAVMAAQIIYNIAHPKKITWMMSMVDEHKRGSFTAVKEAVSLVAGMVFTYTMGSLIDSYRERGEIRTAFVIAVIVILVFSAIHTLSMLFTMEKTPDYGQRKKLWDNVRATLTDKKLLGVVALFVMYTVSRNVSGPFFGTYQINELGFSLQFVSVMGIVSSIARIAASVFWGKYADRRSFLSMMEKCLIFLAVSDVFAMVSQPSWGHITYPVASIFSGIAAG
ncbi:MAG: MFS transporter, partial [Clostridia bacterium]|nr:MFS transporter [Clostridia bacterium]